MLVLHFPALATRLAADYVVSVYLEMAAPVAPRSPAPRNAREMTALQAKGAGMDPVAHGYELPRASICRVRAYIGCVQLYAGAHVGETTSASISLEEAVDKYGLSRTDLSSWRDRITYDVERHGVVVDLPAVFVWSEPVVQER